MRHHKLATVALALLIGTSAGGVGAAVAATRRADSSLQRYLAATSAYDVIALSCPPGVDPRALDSQAEVTRRCGSHTWAATAADELRQLPSVAAVAYSTYFVVAVLDPDAPNGWGRVALTVANSQAGAPLLHGSPPILDGRMPHADAPDEVVVDERAAQTMGLRTGDQIQLASWSLDNLDDGANGGLLPETTAIDAQVVGVIRVADDLAPPGDVDVSGNVPGGSLHVRAGTAARMRHFAHYGYGVLAAVREEDGSMAAFEQQVAELWRDRMYQIDPVLDVDPSSIERVIDYERRAVLVFAAIAAAATIGLAGLTLTRQLRREQRDAATLQALGAVRGELLVAGTLRTVAIGVPAAVVAVAVVVGSSPLGPVGLARRADPSTGVRVDAVVVGVTAVAVVVGVTLAGLLATAMVLRGADRGATQGGRAPTLGGWLRLGPSARSGVTLARASWPRAAAAAVAVGLGTAIAALVAVASFDRVVEEPERYGAWWDAAMGNYSERDALEAGAAALRDDPDVVDLAAFWPAGEVGTIAGQPVSLTAFEVYAGQPRPVVARGRGPATAGEIALGATTMRSLGVDVGDHVVLNSTGESEDGGEADRPIAIELEVVGEAVLNDPVTPSHPAGHGGIVLPAVLERLSAGVPQQLLVRLGEDADRDEVIRRLASTFDGSIRLATPGDDLRNLGRLRTVAWFIAGTVGALAMATMVHALVTMVMRHRRDLAVMAVLGATRSRRTAVVLWACGYLLTAATMVALPLGLILGRSLWRALAGSLGIPADPRIPWMAVILLIAAAVAAAQVISWAATRRPVRAAPARLLRTE